MLILSIVVKDVQFIYMQTEGPNLTTVSPCDLFARIGDFSSLTTRKVVSRLELFQSPAYRCKITGKYVMKVFDHSTFGDIKEEGHVGCGFICEELLADILGNNNVAKMAICVQVRAFVPMKGIYKGMLMRKKITGIIFVNMPTDYK